MNIIEGVGNTLNTEDPFYLNQGLQPLVNFNFMLRVEGIFDLPCKAIHGFKKADACGREKPSHRAL